MPMVPQRRRTDWNANTLLAVPVAEGHFGVKLVTVVPSNAACGLPVTDGLYLISLS